MMKILLSNGLYIENYSLPRNTIVADEYLATDGTGDIYWIGNSQYNSDIKNTLKQTCPRCNNEMEVVKSKTSIFSNDVEDIFKCKKCGYC